MGPLRMKNLASQVGLLRFTGRRPGTEAGFAAAARQSYTGLATGNQGVTNGQPAAWELFFPCLKKGAGRQKMGGKVNQCDCIRALE